jgi:hypothetical protein
MNNKYFKISFAILLVFLVNASVFALPYFNALNDSSKFSIKLKDNRSNRPVFSKLNTDFETFMLKVSAIKRINEKPAGVNFIDLQKPIDNVKIYPNPVISQINISYSLKKDNQVIIKILDVLGNEIFTLLDQKLQAGEQTNSFVLNSKITPGFYFIRIVSGNDSVIKRISVVN